MELVQIADEMNFISCPGYERENVTFANVFSG